MIKLVLDGITRLVIDFVHKEGRTEMFEDLMAFIIADAFYLYVLDYAVEDLNIFSQDAANRFLNYLFFVTILDWGLHKAYFGRPNLMEQLVKVAIVGGVWEIYLSMYPEEVLADAPKCRYQSLWRGKGERDETACKVKA